jgi:hypothetical protein
MEREAGVAPGRDPDRRRDEKMDQSVLRTDRPIFPECLPLRVGEESVACGCAGLLQLLQFHFLGFIWQRLFLVA